MTRIKVISPLGYARLEPGDYVPLPIDRTRKVILWMNVEAPTAVSLIRLEKMKPVDAVFLTSVQPTGPHEIEFWLKEGWAVGADSAGAVWWRTDDGHQEVAHEIRTQSFTSLAQNMDITPQMELVSMKAALRREQRLREQAELLARRAQREVPHDPETGEVEEPHGDVSGDEEPPTGEATPVQPAVSE